MWLAESGGSNVNKKEYDRITVSQDAIVYVSQKANFSLVAFENSSDLNAIYGFLLFALNKNLIFFNL